MVEIVDFIYLAGKNGGGQNTDSQSMDHMDYPYGLPKNGLRR